MAVALACVLVLLCPAVALQYVKPQHPNASYVVHLLPSGGGSSNLDAAFGRAWAFFNDSFDHATYAQLVGHFGEAVGALASPDVGSTFEFVPAGPHCDRPGATPASKVTGLAAFPGGSVQAFGYDASKMLYGLGMGAHGPTSAALAMPTALVPQALAVGAGLVQAVLASIADVVPPLIPPPVWNNMPLPCAPMITGHNCFGAVLHPITMSDLIMSDKTDATLDGYISGFPELYARKVGKTSDVMYKACFASYMSMMCSSMFPRCTTPQSRGEPMAAGGRVPMCLHMCIIPLVACPGLWITDIIGQCSMVSVPPMCSQALYTSTWKAPPQYASFDEANPFPKECPPLDYEGLDALESFELYDVPPVAVSPITQAAKASLNLPKVAQ